MNDPNPYSPPNSALEIPAEPTRRVDPPRGEPQGLGGWLVLVCIGLLLTPLRLGLELFRLYLPLFADGTWQALMDPNDPSYHPAIGSLILAELLANCFLAVLSVWLLTLYFRRSLRFPRWAIVLYASSALIQVGDMAVLSALNVAPDADPVATRELLRSLITVFIWIPYLLISKRVKNTFIQP